MSEEKSNQESKTFQPKPKKMLGREELFDVFKTDGEAELFSRSTQKKKEHESGTRTGPSVQHHITDSQGPSIKHEISDANGPSIAHQISDADGPTIKKAEISDASGPTIAHQMSDADGPIIKNAEIIDAEGAAITHLMTDADGPVMKRFLETTHAKLPAPANPLSTAVKTTQSNHQSTNSVQSESTHRVDTFSIKMAERIAKMKSAQKETLAKMDELDASTNEIQGKLSSKNKK